MMRDLRCLPDERADPAVRSRRNIEIVRFLREAEIREDDLGVGFRAGVVGMGRRALEEDVARFDVAVDNTEPFIRTGLAAGGGGAVVAVVDERQGFGELEVGVPDESLGDPIEGVYGTLLPGSLRFGVVVESFYEGSEVTAGAVVQIELGLQGTYQGGAQIDDARVAG